MNEDQRLAELAQFLRTRRERLSPSDAGLAAGRRRRTPGLRREEVAHLAGLSVAWYTWLEQGRAIRASEELLERLARVLRLDASEYRHLFVLARGHPPADFDPVIPLVIVGAPLRSMIDALPHPAYVVTGEWTVVAWNRAAQLVVADFENLSGRDRNIVWLVFTHPAQRRLMVNWEDQARSLLALFRSSTAHNLGEEWHDRFVADLADHSPEFRAWWPRHDVRVAHAGPKIYDHPLAGRMVFEPLTLRYEGDSLFRIMVKVPVADESDTPAKLARLIAEHGND
ncbi:helix-turn-helix transcriptional regulator [Singulisphaera sp. PoT]|uniref:helix-turn-helix transcriptional regulator n=1 Tax=Singulisphaera sp. PoT TaxID=3411797 RepID=UPI003BF5BFEC